MKELELGKAYRVQWTDSNGTPAGWVSLEDNYPTECPSVTTYGTVISKSDAAVVLAQSVVNETNVIQKQAMGIVTIPYACITTAEELTSSSSVPDSCPPLA